MRVDMFTNKILVNTEFESVSLQHKYSVNIVNKAMQSLDVSFVSEVLSGSHPQTYRKWCLSIILMDF